MSDDTRTRRAAETLRQNSATVRHVGEGIAVAIGIAVIVGFVSIRDDAIFASAWARETAPAFHEKIDARVREMERPELFAQLNRASEAVEEVAEAIKQSNTNAAAIGVLQNETKNLGDGQTRMETQLDRILLKLDNLNVRPAQ